MRSSKFALTLGLGVASAATAATMVLGPVAVTASAATAPAVHAATTTRVLDGASGNGTGVYYHAPPCFCFQHGGKKVISIVVGPGVYYHA